MDRDLVEIRDYHYDPERLDAYRTWAVEAVEVLGARLDLLGFWIDAGEPARISGADPMDLPHGAANVTWMIRWDDLAQREAEWDALWEDPAWGACWERHPGFDGYRHMSVRFLRAVPSRHPRVVPRP